MSSRDIADGIIAGKSIKGKELDKPIGTFRDNLLISGLRTLFLVALLVLWEMISGEGIAIGPVRLAVDKFFISRPSEILADLNRWISTGSLFFHLWITMQEMVIGFIFGSIAGILTGFVLGRNDLLARVLDPFIVAVYSLPKIALAPLFILWFGLDLTPKIVLVAVVVFFLVFYNTFTGVRDIDRDLLDVVRIMGGNRLHLLWKVIVPGSTGMILLGLKLSVPYALVGAVVGEMMASNKGIGFLLQNAGGQFHTSGVFAALFVLMIISFIINEILVRSEGTLTRWKSAGK